MNRVELLEKIRKVEALFSATDCAGEKEAARSALDRLQKQLVQSPEPLLEFQFSLPDPWKRRLFMALARRHGLTPYRLRRQRYSTVMLRISQRDLDTCLWPEFLELSKLLQTYLEEATNDIIATAIHQDLSDASEQPNLPLG